MLNQATRGEARKLARIRYGMKHKAKIKPLAPVEETTLKEPISKARYWRWVGEIMPLKGLVPGELYIAGELRVAGFKLPRLKCKSKGEKAR